jgi:hypothetical protein
MLGRSGFSRDLFACGVPYGKADQVGPKFRKELRCADGVG